MRMKWFRRTRFLYLPMSVVGFVVYIAAVVFLITVFVAVDRHSHSMSDTLYGIFPYFVTTFLLVDWLGAKTSE